MPAPRDGELAWVQHCHAHLRPHGAAVIAVSPRTCMAPPGQAIREKMVRDGALRAVVAPPPKMSSLPGVDVHLWVLRRPTRRRGHVRTRRVRCSSALPVMAEVPQQYSLWQQLFDQAQVGSQGSARPQPGPAIARSVPRLRLLDGETNLLPSRHGISGAEASADDLDQALGRLEALYARVSAGLPHYADAGRRTGYTFATGAELERTGALHIRRRDTPPRAGDVLIWPQRAPFVARGTERAGLLRGHILELDLDKLDADFVATFLRDEISGVPVPNTFGVLSRAGLRRCRIPRLPLAEQRRYGAEFRRLSELREALASLARLTNAVLDQRLHGLTSGTLAPRRHLPKPPAREKEEGL